jgi:hypothetical protein
MKREENTASLGALGGRITNIAKLVGLSASDDAVEASFLVVPPDNDGDDDSTDKDDPEGTAGDACALRPDGKWKCPPNRRSALLEEIAKANKGNSNHGAVLETLKSAGIRIFVIDSRSSPTIREIMDSSKYACIAVLNSKSPGLPLTVALSIYS